MASGPEHSTRWVDRPGPLWCAGRVDPRLPDRLIRDELFDLSLYQALRETADGELARLLDELIRVETRHFAFWQEFFGRRVDRLDAGRRLRLALLRGLCRLFGRPAVHLVLEAIEVYGVRKYLSVWDAYRGQPLGEAVRGILEDEFRHEDAIVTGVAERRISPARIRNIFLGLNDGLVEIVGAVSGFFAAFSEAGTVLVAGSTVAVAGALSMAAGAYVATSSEAEVRRTEEERRRFLASAGDARVAGGAGRAAAGGRRPGRVQLSRRRPDPGAPGAPRRADRVAVAPHRRDRDGARLDAARVPLGHGRAPPDPDQRADHGHRGRGHLRDRRHRARPLGRFHLRASSGGRRLTVWEFLPG